MYTCDECGRRIMADGTGRDPVHVLSRRGVLCSGCLRKPDPREAALTPSVDRRAAAKARWAAMPAKERAAWIAKMRASQAARGADAAADTV
jgi:hypothetical protein